MGVNGEALQLHAVYKKPYFLLQVTRESVSVLQVTRDSVSGTTSHTRIRIRYYKSRALCLNVQCSCLLRDILNWCCLIGVSLSKTNTCMLTFPFSQTSSCCVWTIKYTFTVESTRDQVFQHAYMSVKIVTRYVCFGRATEALASTVQGLAIV